MDPGFISEDDKSDQHPILKAERTFADCQSEARERSEHCPPTTKFERDVVMGNSGLLDSTAESCPAKAERQLSVTQELSSQSPERQSEEDARLRAYIAQFQCRPERTLSRHESSQLTRGGEEKHQAREGEPRGGEERWQQQFFTFLNPVAATFYFDRPLKQSKNASLQRFRAGHTSSDGDTERKVKLLEPHHYQRDFIGFCDFCIRRISWKGATSVKPGHFGNFNFTLCASPFLRVTCGILLILPKHEKDQAFFVKGANRWLTGCSRLLQITCSANLRRSASGMPHPVRDSSTHNNSSTHNRSCSKDDAKAFLLLAKQRLADDAVTFEWILTTLLDIADLESKYSYFQRLLRIVGFLGPYKDLVEEFHRFLPPDCTVDVY
eukprot:scpid24904/ scgid15352/ 